MATLYLIGAEKGFLQKNFISAKPAQTSTCGIFSFNKIYKLN
jgi:hypothetical protein